ncbi:hypothetical protein [Hymenobacter jeollabukensis]|uniref:Glycosyltransferase RgtA/B/C/D-like domain-containing protein n=1 Tax=Hymenobacter jeollabukensis TaxID=2025313 RepID=A0A5R8WNY8_9BACT|nr:hypothetical protein [Hymenobacter jeollabukensis]TLM91696.1 hypothetical protein FDY95_14125 [Hymenobacter jeollabukensis]
MGLLLVLAICLGPGLIFGLSHYADVAHLRHVRYHDATFRYLPIPLTPAGYAQAKLAWLGLTLLGSTVLLWQWRRRGRLYRELAALHREWRAAPPLLAPWRRLRPAERRTALLLFGALLLVRSYYLLRYPLYGDEVVTYLSFVRAGGLAAVSFYPIPNNHIGYSLICWLFSLVSPNFYWATRLPTFLLSALGTAGVGLLLLRHVNFRVAALTVFLFGFFPYALFQSVVGRGYFLLAVCAQLGFLAVLTLLRRPMRPRLAWALLVGSSVVGLYAMPSYLLVFGSLLAGLAADFLWQQRPARLWSLGLAGMVVGGAAALLYAPVLLVSGPRALLANGYVAPGAGYTAGLTALDFLARTEGQLLGAGPLGLAVVGGLSLAGLLLGYRQRALLPLVLLALGLLWLPYLPLLLRGVYPPARVLSYRVFFLFLLAALLLETGLRWPPLAALRRRPVLSVALPVLAWAGVAVLLFQRRATQEAARNERVTHSYAWLRAHGARRVLVEAPHYQLYLQFFSQTNHTGLRIDAATAAEPGARYQFYLLDKEQYRKFRIPLPVVFENEDIRIYRWPTPR